MYFEVDGKCKQCGAELHLVLSYGDSWGDVFQVAECHACGHHATGEDTWKFIHLLDTLATTDDLNNMASFSRIIIHR